MKKLTQQILATGLFLFFLAGSNQSFAGNPTTPSTSSTSTQSVTKQQVITYVAQLGARAVVVSTPTGAANKSVVTTTSGSHILIYTNGNQIIGHEDLPY
jgi:hypothetical protein